MNDHKGENGTWKNSALHVMWAIIVAIMGFFLTEGSTERANVRTDTQRIEKKQNDDSARIAVLEEQFRTNREILRRIEDGVEELRRAPQSRPR
jgi:hypothetical protein